MVRSGPIVSFASQFLITRDTLARMPALAAIALIVLLQDTGEQFFKFKVGSTWTYKLIEGPFEGKSITTVTKLDGDRVHVESTDVLEGKDRRAERYIWQVDKGVLQWLREVEEGKFEPMFNLYKVGSKKGDTWPGAPEGGRVRLTATHGGTEDVTVAAGTYKDAVVVKLTGKSDDPTQKTDISVTFWFASNVGVVKGVVDFGDDKNTLELAEFKEGK
jgi:hypothetical protein